VSEGQEIERLFAMLAEVRQFNQIEKIRESLPELDKSLATFDLPNGAATIAGLMLLPEFQSNAVRLEALSHLFCLRASGDQRVTSEHLSTWLNEDLGNSLACRMEDPSEDVFVSNVITRQGNRRLLQGLWNNPDSAVQDVVDILESVPRSAGLQRLCEEVDAILALGELTAGRAGLQRFSAVESAPWQVMGIPGDKRLAELASMARFSRNDLKNAEISFAALSPFVLHGQSREHLATERVGHSSLERFPLLEHGENLLLALPTAVSAAIRRHALETLSSLGLLDVFSEALRKKQRHDLKRMALRIGKRGLDPSKLIPSSDLAEERLFEAIVPFDEGKLAHVLLLHDECRETLRDGLAGHGKWPPAVAEKLVKHLEKSVEALSLKPETLGGLTVVVLGGLGKGFQLELPRFSGRWGLCVWTLPDLLRLSWMEEEWLLKCWKLKTQLRELEARGIFFDRGTEDVDLFAYWKHQAGRLLPRDFSAASEGHVTVTSDFVQDFRQSGRKSYDAHAVFKRDEGRWVRVQRKVTDSYFKDVEAAPVYASPMHVEGGVLCAVVENGPAAWWLECQPDTEEKWERELQYRLWDGATCWLARVITILERRRKQAMRASLIIRLDLRPLNGVCSPDDLASIAEEPPIKTRFEQEAGIAVLRLNPTFVRLLTRPENDAERTLAGALIEVVLGVLGPAAEGEAAEILRAVVPDPAMRFIHAFPAQTVRDAISELAGSEGRFVQEEDQRFSAIGLAWTVRTPTSGQTVEGREECESFLHSVVDTVWQRIKEELKQIDRRSLVEKCFCNIESLETDNEQWKRTAQALLAVHEDRDDVVQAAHRRQLKRDRSRTSTRVLLEMGLSTCVLAGGKKLGNSEFDRLLADVVLLILTAHEADAVHFDLAKPQITLWANGEFALVDTSLESIVAPYQKGIFSDQFKSHAAGYADLYAGDRGRRSPEDVFGLDFVRAFAAEYGISVGQVVTADAMLQDFAVARQTAVVTMTRHAFAELMTGSAGLSEAEVERLLASFASFPRERWDAAPKGYRDKDWYPWRFRRRLSVLSRPLVQLGITPEDEIMCASGFLHDALGYVVEGAFRGRFVPAYFGSSAMRSWIGHVKDRDGHEFNERVASKFREIGFQARSSVSMSEFNVPSELGDYGDLDVVAWSEDGTVYLIECKNLRFAMTVGEVAEQLSRFRGEAGDELAKHLRRCDWLSGHPDRLERVTGTELQGKAANPLLVLNTIAPMQFKEGLPLATNRIIAFSELEARIPKAGRAR